MPTDNVVRLAAPTADPRPFPPRNIEAEQAVLGSAMINNAVAARCRFLSPEDFFEPVHGRVWQAILRTVEAGRLADPVTLKTIFDADGSLSDLDGGGYLARMAGCAERIVDAVEYAGIVRRLARRRRLAEVCRALAERAECPGETADVAELVAERRADLDALCHDDTASLGRDIQDVVDELVGVVERPARLYRTGIGALDDSLGGGFPLGYVIGLQARPKSFKTGCCHTVALAAARQGIPTMYLALEMGSARLVQRMLGHAGTFGEPPGGFNSAMFRHRDGLLMDKVLGAREHLPPMRLLDCPGMRFSRLRSVASEAVVRLGTKLFVLDYYQLVRGDEGSRNRTEHLDDVAQWVAAFSAEHKVTWIVASQENREGYTRGSDGLIMSADWLATLHKHEQRFYLEGHGHVETLWMTVDYSRDGPGDNIGGPEDVRLFIDPRGPHLAEMP